jgi:hypothetical protein
MKDQTRELRWWTSWLRTVEGERGGLVGRLGPAHAAVAAVSRGRQQQQQGAEEQE